MDKVIGRLNGQTTIVYIDDIFINSRDLSTHILDIETMLSLVAKSALTLSLAKCHLAYQSLPLLVIRSVSWVLVLPMAQSRL
jgi:hypothetical protein